MSAVPGRGVPASELADEDMLRELEQLYQTRMHTLRNGSDDALENSTRRINELEQDYLRRFPQREVDPERLRSGARERGLGDR